jgi:hypothetical protein
MPLPTPLLRRLGDATNSLPHAADDARRLAGRLARWTDELHLIDDGGDRDALELAAWALHLPDAHVPGGRLGAQNLRTRAARAAERLVELLAGHADSDLLDRTARLLHETPQRPPILDDAKLLCDALNLDDFGLTGLARLAAETRGTEPLRQALAARQRYRYWEARLRDGFYFDHPRALARRRLEAMVRATKTLEAEQRE